MSDRKPAEPAKTQTPAPRPERLVELYRDIGVSAVVAVFCVLSGPGKDAARSEEGAAPLPAVLQQDSSSD